MTYVQFDKTPCCQLLQWVRFLQWWFYWSRWVSGYFLFLSQQVFTVCTINIWESVSFELWIFLQLLPHLRWGVSIVFFNQPNGWGKLAILGENLGVMASPRYIRIHGIMGRVLTRLTCICCHSREGKTLSDSWINTVLILLLFFADRLRWNLWTDSGWGNICFGCSFLQDGWSHTFCPCYMALFCVWWSCVPFLCHQQVSGGSPCKNGHSSHFLIRILHRCLRTVQEILMIVVSEA